MLHFTTLFNLFVAISTHEVNIKSNPDAGSIHTGLLLYKESNAV